MKARIVAETVAELDLEIVVVMPSRAEEVLRGRSSIVIRARAVAPLAKALDLIGPAIRVGCRALLYKGPDADTEIAKAGVGLRKYASQARVVSEYILPDELGKRTIVEVARRG
jgi:16S rRNA (guanine527-N7)-methyltransferase